MAAVALTLAVIDCQPIRTEIRMAQEQIRLDGRVAVVTGSTRGIGRAIVERLGRAGAKVVVSSSRAEAVAQAAAELSAQGIAAIGVACNVSERAQVEQLRDAAIAKWGKVDIWINNAGISGPFALTLDVPPETWEQVIRINLMGTYYGSAAILPHMIANRYGKLINLSGGGAKRAQRFLSAYSTTKAAIVRFTEGLARDYADQRFLAINVLTPTIVPTDMTDLMTDKAIGKTASEALKQFPRVQKIFGAPASETAEIALRMASSATDGVSGKVFEQMPRHRAIWRLAKSLFSKG